MPDAAIARRRVALAACLCALLLPAPQAAAQMSTPGAVSTNERLQPPPMPANPTQADLGAQVYYLVCMACHGDRGQGLTDEWRAAWAPGDQNCWQGKCHAGNHPPEGFELVRYVPPVVGPGILDKFGTGAALFNYVDTRMPWQAPGSLSDEEYWQVTAFLLRANGVYNRETTLGPENAAGVAIAGSGGEATADLPPVAPPDMPPVDSHAAGGGPVAGWWAALAAVVVIAFVALAIALRRSRR